MRFLVGVIWISLFAGCSGNGHVEQKPFIVQPGDDVVNCACNMTFDYPSCTGGTCFEHFEVQLCLPPSLQQSSPGPDYANQIDQYCRNVVTRTIYHLIVVWNASFCGYKSAYAPDGGVGQAVECFAQPLDGSKMSATARDDGTCATSCPEVDCDYATNCHDVQDSFGTPDLDKCKCSRIPGPGGSCPGDPTSDFPGPLFCRPPKDVTLTQ